MLFNSRQGNVVYLQETVDDSVVANSLIVYHCKSDTESLHDGSDVVLSATCFLDKPLTLAVMYGCTDNTIQEITWELKRCAKSAFNLLMLPLMFAHIERSRFLKAIDNKATELGGRILELERRVMKETTQDSAQEKNETEGGKTMTERDCNAIHMCSSMTSLKNGLVSFVTELQSMRDHLQALQVSKIVRRQEGDTASGQKQVQDDEMHIDSKLYAMIAELQSKIRTCEGHLGAMTMATQMEWNYYTRRDAQVNYSIATAARMDGSQMKQISRLGMIFLPGTFLATFFSMTFFSWLPQDSSQVASPWLALYFGATALVTIVTVVWLERRSSKEMKTAKAQLQQELDKDTDSTLFSRLTFSRSSSMKATSRDVESQGSRTAS
ncbi:hypothetical protein DHEL01_v208796 [Diaporthe helianthi]|uniref:Uncharacterized protein n=1 Tax=Diaporthe helianthi TaxID=158607 RepID=A0A2P5HRC1_DIAHE|nr:hypothetical protein DHEL01_v208796 [Diaporthe helianthi]